MQSPTWVSGLLHQVSFDPVSPGRPLTFVPPIPLFSMKSWCRGSVRSFVFAWQELPATQRRYLLSLSVHLYSTNSGSARRDSKRRSRAVEGSERSAMREVVGSWFVAIHRIPLFDSLNRQTD